MPPIPLFLCQAAVILIACRVVAALLARFGQSRAVGEMIAGIMLGPSLFGRFAPGTFAALFPESSIGPLRLVGTFALTVYMFLVGLGIDTSVIRNNFRIAARISIAGVVAPFVLGGALGYALYQQDGFFPVNVALAPAILFCGAAISVTAFPVLARILRERNLVGTRLGSLVLTSAAVDDVASWALLAVVLATVGGSPHAAAIALVGGPLFVLVAFGALKPLLARTWPSAPGSTPSEAALAALAIAAAAGAWTTNALGLHSIFGAFVVGAAVPRGDATKRLLHVLEPPIATLFLPIFFAISGLRTKLTLIDSLSMWGVTLAVIIVASIGKGGACAIAARRGGEPIRTSLAIGALMNARGLVELVILNIGLEAGLLSPALFAIFVVMALVTTMLAGPIFSWVHVKYLIVAMITALAVWRPCIPPITDVHLYMW